MGGFMGEQGVLPAVRVTIERVSGGAIAIFGLALALFAYESSRMSAFQNVQAQTTLLDLTPSAAIIFAIVALLIGYEKHPTLRIHRHPLAGFALAALFALSSLALARNGFIVPQNDWVSFLARCARNISVILMLACWMEAILPKRARDVGIVLALAIIALAGLNVLSALFKEGAAHILVAVVPFLSMACLYWYKDHEVLEQSSSIASADAYAALKVDTALMPESVTGATIASTLLNFLIPLGCYSFVFGYMHYAWIPTQDGTVASLAIQLAAALGTLIAGIVLLCLVTTFWGRRKIELYNFFALSIMVLALCITALASDRFTFMYVVPLNIAQKIAMFFIWMAPFLVPHRRSAMTSWCWALLLYQAGKLASSSASSFIDQDTYLVLALAFAGLLIIGSIFGLVLGQNRSSTAVAEGKAPVEESDAFRTCKRELFEESNAADGSAVEDRAERACLDRSAQEGALDSSEEARENAQSACIGHQGSRAGEPAAQNERRALVLSCSSIAKTYQLTRREDEVLQLLSEGMTAKDVAETLVVSSSTAKTHMRNIYAKLGIHTQNELILMVQRRMHANTQP